MAFLATDQKNQRFLWIRPLEAIDAHPLKGTEGATSPFWSPDSRFLGFFVDGALKKIDVTGGPPQLITNIIGRGSGATWNCDDVILLNAGGNAGLSRISAGGGALTPVTTLEAREIRHTQPCFLPDGRHFLYSSFTGGILTDVYVGSLDSNQRKLLIKGSLSLFGKYAQEHILFAREGILMAQQFDSERLELIGNPFPIAEIHQFGNFAVSENGVLAYSKGTQLGRLQLAWYDRSGKQLESLGEPADYYSVEISPDGTRAAFGIRDQTGKADVWIQDLSRGLRRRFTFGEGRADRAMWSMDGKRLIFDMRQKDHDVLVQKNADGSGAEQVLLDDKFTKYPASWSPDGRFVMYVTVPGSPTTGNDLWVLPLIGDRKPYPYSQTQYSEFYGQFSPDGRWVVYASNESGRSEVYVASFPKPVGKRQISTAGGNNPRWRRDGKEIYFTSPPGNTLMAAAVNGEGASFEVAAVRPLFQVDSPGVDNWYDVSADGKRFLMIRAAEDTTDSNITVVVNWLAALKH